MPNAIAAGALGGILFALIFVGHMPIAIFFRMPDVIEKRFKDEDSAGPTRVIFWGIFALIPTMGLAGVGLAAVLVIAPLASALTTEVNVYSARKEVLIKPLLDAFTAETGIAVNLVSGKADALLQRLEREGANSPADVLLTTDAGRLVRANQAGLLQATPTATLSAAIPAQYRDPAGAWFGLSLRARPIMYSVDRVSPAELSSYAALAGP